jgi:hypothetical protein
MRGCTIRSDEKMKFKELFSTFKEGSPIKRSRMERLLGL